MSNTRISDYSVGFSFQEVGCLHSSKNKVLASHFSSNGKFLASAGHDKKVVQSNQSSNLVYFIPS
jgi:hypothetical protein